MKFNKSKFWIRGNPNYTYSLGDETLESIFNERDLGALVKSKLNIN